MITAYCYHNPEGACSEMNCATAASTQALVTALLLQVSNDCVDAAADVLAVVLCRCLSFPACSSLCALASAISPMRALRLRPEDSCRVSFACCYTYAGLGFCLMKCSRMRGAPLLKSRNSGIWHQHRASRKSAPSVP